MVFPLVAGFVLAIFLASVSLVRCGFIKGEMGTCEHHSDHVTKSFLVPRWVLGAIRLAICAFQTIFIVYCAKQPALSEACTLGEGCVPFAGRNLWATFTVWCWTGQIVYFGFAGMACIAGDKMSHFQSGMFFLWVLYQCMFAMAVLVTLTVWIVLVPTLHLGAHLGFSEAGQGLAIMYSLFGFVTHVLNLVFMFVELFLNRLSFKTNHVYFCNIWGILYVCFSWLFHARTGVFFYFFLDYRPVYAVVPYMICAAVIYAYFLFGEWCSDRLKSPELVPPRKTKTICLK